MSGMFSTIEVPRTLEAFSRGKHPTARYGQQGLITNASGFAGSCTTVGKHISSFSTATLANAASNDLSLLPGRTVNGLLKVTTLSQNTTITMPSAAQIVAYLFPARTQKNALPAAGSAANHTYYDTIISNLNNLFDVAIGPGAGQTYENGGINSVKPGETIHLRTFVTETTAGSEAISTFVLSHGMVFPSGEGDIIVTSKGWDAGDAGSVLEFIADDALRVVGVSGMPTVDASAQADFTVQKVTGGAVGNQMLSAALSLNGTGDLTRVAGTLTATTADLLLTAGDGIRVTLTGVATNLAGALIVIRLRKRSG